MKKINKTEISIKNVIELYKPDNDTFSKDSILVSNLKEILFTKLSENERNIIILYSENPSQRTLAKTLNVSVRTVNLEIKRIRKKVENILRNEYNN